MDRLIAREGPPQQESVSGIDRKLAILLHEAQERVEHLRQLEAQAQQLVEALQARAAPLPGESAGGRWLAWARNLLGVQLGVLWQHYPRPLRLPAHYNRTQPPNPAPLLALVTPSLNQGKFLEATLRSVHDQEYPRLEHVVQDGGSTDGTCSLLERYREKLHFWESVPDHGQAQAINRGFRHATGEIMAWLNADDLLLPGSLAYVARYFQEHPQVDVVFGHRILIDEQGQEVGRWVLPPGADRLLPWTDYIPQETLFWRRRIWEKVGGALNETYHFALDWELLLRFHQAGARFARLPRFLGAFRIHDAQKTQREHQQGMIEKDRLYRVYHGRPVNRFEIRQRVAGFLFRHLIHRWLYEGGLVRY